MTSNYFVIGNRYRSTRTGGTYTCVGYPTDPHINAVYLIEDYVENAKKFSYTYFENLRPFSFYWVLISTPEQILEGDLFI